MPHTWCPHCMTWVSVPRHATSSSQVGPLPAPNWLPNETALSVLVQQICIMVLSKSNRILSNKSFIMYNTNPNYPFPIILQKTLASLLSKSSSHTVPHVPLKKTSSLPLSELEPPARRTDTARISLQNNFCYYCLPSLR